MSYPRKKYFGKRKAVSKKSVGLNKVQTALWYAKKAYSLGKYMHGMINCEKKYADNVYSGTIDYSGAVNLLCALGEGSDVNQRNGNSILLRSLNFKQTWTMNVANQDTLVRTIIFLDTMNTGSTPTVTDILNTAGSANAPMSPLNIDHLPRYKILRDTSKVLNASGITQHEIIHFIKTYVHIKYTDTTGTSVYKNALYVLNISDKLTNLPSVNAVFRIGFYDN